MSAGGSIFQPHRLLKVQIAGAAVARVAHSETNSATACLCIRAAARGAAAILNRGTRVKGGE